MFCPNSQVCHRLWVRDVFLFSEIKSRWFNKCITRPPRQGLLQAELYTERHPSQNIPNGENCATCWPLLFWQKFINIVIRLLEKFSPTQAHTLFCWPVSTSSVTILFKTHNKSSIKSRHMEITNCSIKNNSMQFWVGKVSSSSKYRAFTGNLNTSICEKLSESHTNNVASHTTATTSAGAFPVPQASS